MLQELAAGTGASAWAIASMLFFLGVWIVITVSVLRTRPEELEARARLALEGDEPGYPGPEGPGLRRAEGRSAGPSGPANESRS